MQSVNDAQFLNITPLILPSNCFAVSYAPVPVIVIAPLTSNNHINLILTLKF